MLFLATIHLYSLNGIFKMLGRGPRPYWVSAKVQPLVHEKSFGIPSGHAMNATSVWGGVAREAKQRWVTILCVALVLLVSFSRLVLGVHFISDVLAGLALGGLLLLVGVVNIPIIYFSVKWWNTLHQGSSVNLTKSSMAETMLWGMLLMAMCFWMYSIAVAFMRVRTIMLERERHTDWVKAELAEKVAGDEK